MTDIQDNLERVARLIVSLDTQPAQVLIESKIVEAKESFTRRIGVDWRSSGGSISFGNTSRGPITMRPSLSVNPGGAPQGQFNLGINIGTFDLFGDLSASLSLAETEEQVKVISSPRIMAMSNEKANINQTTEVPIKQVTVNGNTTQETFQFKPLQLKLEVTPQVTSDGSVIMTVAVNRQFRGATVSSQTDAFSVNSREANTKVLVKNGHTAVIGGIYQSDATDGEVGVPWFRELPIVGYLFKTKNITKEKSELLVFLTPRILGQIDGGNSAQNQSQDF
ncbi:Type IV pilus biogenesis and competence protein PilQ precursor [compost metagenome]